MTDPLNLLIEKWNNTDALFPDTKTISQLIEEQAAATPNNIAIVYEQHTLTYQELNQVANRLAHYLQQNYELKANSLIALFFGKNEQMLIAILAILKIGAAFVPIDIEYPINRIIYILEDTQAKLVITHEPHYLQLETILKNEKKVTSSILNISGLRFQKKCSQYSGANLPLAAKGTDLAYVIYTSGTTGRPKGCLNEHMAFVNRSYFLINNYSFNSADVFLQRTPYVFDVAAWEFLTPLFCGAKIIIPSDPAAKNFHALKNLINKYSVTKIHFTPSLLDAFLDQLEDPQKSCGSIQAIYASGEELSPTLVKKFKSKMPAVDLHNIYGPSEADITHFDHIRDTGAIRIPIGKPIHNVKAYILDSNLNLQPIGVEGELYIGGLGLARGYINQPELTQERFIANPFQTEREKRLNKNKQLYKTGDLARWLPDGNIEYLGRNDFQVKIHGHRIELNEIENTLNLYPNIKQSVIVVKEQQKNSKKTKKHLIGYYVATKNLSEDDILNYLSAHLPYYMIPSKLMQLSAFPLTINGKLDRQALPIPEWEAHTSYIAPTNQIELKLTQLWSEILEIDSQKISIKDNFFKLGGHSLAAMRLCSKINQVFGHNLYITVIFHCNTVETLSQYIKNIGMPVQTISPAPILKRPTYIPLSLMQKHIWIVDQLQPNSALYHIVSRCELTGTLDLTALKKSLSVIVKRHESLRTIIGEKDGEPYQIICPHRDEINFTLEQHPIEYKNLLINNEENLHFNLTTGPLYHLHLQSFGQQSHIFIFTAHHIIADGWSLAIFYEELSQNYAYFSQEKHGELPIQPLELQYADFALYQRNFFSHEILEKQIQYWQNKLQNIPDLTLLPLDKPNLVNRSYKSDIITLIIPDALQEQLAEVEYQYQVTLYMLLLAVYMITLKKYSQQNRIVVGSPIANRKFPALEKNFGFFINMLAIDAEFNLEINFITLLTQVKETILNALQNQDAPFEEVVKVLNINRDLSRNPIFNVAFVLNNMKQPTLELPGIKCSNITTGNALVKFDLLLTATQQKDYLELIFEYPKDVFERETIQRFSNNFLVFLKNCINQPTAPLEKILYLADPEKNIIKKWCAPQQTYEITDSLHRLFEKNLDKFYELPCLYFENRSITFGQFNSLANKLAHYLIEQGVLPGDFILVSMHKNIEFAITFLAVLKAGGVYLPISQDLKPSQIAAIQKNIRYKLIICDEKSIPTFSQDTKCIIYSENLAQRLQFYKGINPNVATTPKDYLYVLFTSGSTGIAKGVPGKHCGILNRFYWMWEQFPYTKEDKCCLFTPINTIDVVFELFGPLLQGKSVLILTENDILDTEQFIQRLAQHKITRIDFVPSYLKTLLNSHPDIAQRLPHLKIWGVNGELLPQSLIQQFAALLPDRLLISRYGATEATTTFFHAYQHGQLVQFGTASGAILRILDENKQLLPIGAPGEIYVSGPTLTDCYLNQPELSNKKFIQFNDDGPKFFNSGDLAKFRSDGSIEFLGRKDFQVKIRGFTVDLQQIEETIQNKNYVKNIIVLAKNDVSDQLKIIAFVILKEGINKTPEEIRNDTKKELPSYMVPSMVLIISSLPLTHNGKIDRQSLIKYSSEILIDNGLVAQTPNNENEEKVQKIWQELLGIPVMNINANFFELGGHSLLATRMLAQIRKFFSISITLRDILLEPTISAIAKKIDQLTEQPLEIDLMINARNN